MNTENTAKITFYQSAIALSIARANYWTTFANTPANLEREVYHGYMHPLSKDELIDDAMKTANTHLMNAQENLDQLNLLIHN